MSKIITVGSTHKTVFTAEEGVNVEAADMTLAKQAADLLNSHYPGHLWAVNVNSEGGVMVIKNLAIASSYGMVLHLKNVYQDPTLKCVVKSGGEFLERAHMMRGRWSGEDAKELEGVKTEHKPRNGLIF